MSALPHPDTDDDDDGTLINDGEGHLATGSQQTHEQDPVLAQMPPNGPNTF